MKWYDYLLIYFSSCIIILFVLKSYSNISYINNNNNNNKLRKILIIIFGGFLITYSLYNNGTYENILVSLVVFSMSNIIAYNKNPFKTIINTMIIYLFIVLYEILLSIIIINVFKFSLEVFNTNSIIKSIFSIVDVFLAYLTCTNKYIKKLINIIAKKNILINTFFPLIILCLIILDAKYIFFSLKEIYLGNIIIISSLLYLLSFSIITDHKLIKENEKTEILLNSMTKYEKIIDDDRAFKHELLNNLLVLKNYKNKNSKEYNDLLNELIDYNNNKNVSIKNIYNLPSGLKGIFYYKIYSLSDSTYNISINVSKKLDRLFNKVSHKNYISLYKLIGIVLDNAIEACSVSKEKILIVNIYEENNDICFDISNSFKGRIKIDDINKKGYTTKGEKRGLGLYLAKSIIKNSEKLSMEQFINNKIFTAKIKVSL